MELCQQRRGDRYFDQRRTRHRMERKARRLAPAIVIMRDRRDAGGIGIARFRQHRKRPGRALVDREAGRTIAGHGDTCGILDQRAGPDEVGGKLFRSKSKDAVMAVTMAGDFMPIFNDTTDQRGITLGYPAKREKGCLYVRIIEQFQHQIGVALDPALPRIPTVPVDDGFKRPDLKPVFNIHRERVKHRMIIPLKSDMDAAIKLRDYSA